MRSIRALIVRIVAICSRRLHQGEFEAELAEHFQLHIAENLRRGMSADEARLDALRRFGGVTRAKENMRAAWAPPGLGQVLQDARYAGRTLRRSPGFAATVILTLAMGVGLNTAIFTIISSVVLRPLPYLKPDRLVAFVATSPSGSNRGASPAQFNMWKETAGVKDIAAHWFTTVNLSGNEPEQVTAGWASATFFDLLGVSPLLGRTFTQAEDSVGGGRVAVVGERVWRRRFGSDRAVLGKTLAVNGEPHVVVGVVADVDIEALRQPVNPADMPSPGIWLPAQIDPASSVVIPEFVVLGRLADGAAMASVNAQLAVVAQRFRERHPAAVPSILHPQGSFAIEPFTEIAVGNVRPTLWIFAGAVGLVLAIACANIASVTLARGIDRYREITVCAALGASRSRVVRQLLTESAILALAGGTLGLVLGHTALRELLRLTPGDIPRIGPDGGGLVADWRLFVFSVGVTLITVVLAGFLPAWRVVRGNRLAVGLRRMVGHADRGQQRVRKALLVGEVAMSVVLLVGAALLLRTFVALRAVDPGFEAEGVITTWLTSSDSRFARTAEVADAIRAGIDGLRELPGVTNAAATCCVPLQPQLGLPFVVDDLAPASTFHGTAGFAPISHGFFETFRIPLQQGRLLTAEDTIGMPGVVIVNEAMARQFWPDGNPLGSTISIGKGLAPQVPPRQVVGIVGNVKVRGLNEPDAPMMYVPWAQLSDAQNANLLRRGMTWVIRIEQGRESARLRASIQEVVRRASGGSPTSEPRWMTDIVSRSISRSSFQTTVLSVFAGSALLLAAVGLYGLMAHSVQIRRPEFGIRLALGAAPQNVRSALLSEGVRIAAVGLAVGLIGAVTLAHLLASLLFGVTARDPLTFGVVALIVGAVAFVGVLVPSRRAASLDPVAAVRSE